MSQHSDENLETPTTAEGERRELAVMRAGERAFAVYADEADSVTEGLRPTPLPGAPPAVLGLVCVRGRMRTVLDPLLLLDENTRGPHAEGDTVSPRFIVSLRGDEQLALAVERVERIIAAPARALEQNTNAAVPLRGRLILDGVPVLVLDPARLFDAAMQDADRRRPRVVNHDEK